MYTQPVELFYNLTPHLALDSIEAQGFRSTGRYTQLNSYENRVFSIEIENEHLTDRAFKDLTAEEFSTVIAKFYRPGRWSKEAIQEEHDFLLELKSEGIPAVAPLKINNESIFLTGEIYSSLFPKQMGRIPQELKLTELKAVGTLLARLHNVGAKQKAINRPTISAESYGYKSLDVLDSIVSNEVHARYFNAAEDILGFLDDRLDPSKYLRIHGDCHKGNILQTDPLKGSKEYFFVDFDDFCNGPAVQDFWFLLSGDQDEKEQDALLEGYSELRNFDKKDLELIPGLRGLRMIYYSAWIAMRWEDPSFKQAFDNFLSYNYWAQVTDDLEKIRRQIT